MNPRFSRSIRTFIALLFLGAFTVNPSIATECIEVLPPAPTDRDVITVTINTYAPTPCYGEAIVETSMADNRIVFSVSFESPPPGTFCIQVLHPRTVETEVGPLAAGTYTMTAETQGGSCSAEVIVTASGDGSDSNGQCVTRFDSVNNIVRIPCLVVEGQEFWANLTLTSEGEPVFELHSYGRDFLPSWLTEKIREFESKPVVNPPRRVDQYEYKDSVVYGISPPCCDQFYDVYDANGSVICAPSGGFSGTGDGRCTDFFEQSSDPVVVWEDTRTVE